MVRLNGAEDDLLESALKDDTREQRLIYESMGAGVLTACTLFILGMLLQSVTGFPGPVLMIVAAAILKCVDAELRVKPNEAPNSYTSLFPVILRFR